MPLTNRLTTDYIPPQRYVPPYVAPVASTPQKPQPGNGTFSDQVRGTQPQQANDTNFARMANDVYTLGNPANPQNVDGRQSLADLQAAGWQRLEPSGDHLVDADGHVIHIDPSQLENSATGFRAAIYQNDQGQYVVAYAGTDPGEFGDISADATQALGLDTVQYNQAVALAKEAEVEFGNGNVAFTGHSLGGGLASAASIATGGSAVTFNAAGVSNDTMRDLGFGANATRSDLQDNGQIRRYVVAGDPLTAAQEDVPTLPIVGSPPDAVGHRLDIALPAGMTPVIDSHGGSGDGTSYVLALEQNTASDAPAPGLLPNLLGDAGDYAFNQLGNAFDTGLGIFNAGKNEVKEQASEISNVIDTDFANGNYVKGTFSIAGDVLDGGVDFLGNTASSLISGAGDGVQNVADFGGSLIRDLGDAVGLEGAGNAVAGFVEGTGEVVSDITDTVGDGVSWATDKLGDGAEAVSDFVGDVGEGISDAMPWNW